MLKHIKDQLNVLKQPMVTMLPEFCMLTGSSGSSSLVHFKALSSSNSSCPTEMRCWVWYSTFLSSTEPKRTQIYTELPSPGEDGPSMSEMRIAPGCSTQVTLVNQHHSMKTNSTRSTNLLLHILWKDSCHSLPLALGKATYKITQIYFFLTCIFVLKASHDKGPEGILFPFFQWNSSIQCVTRIFKY